MFKRTFQYSASRRSLWPRPLPESQHAPRQNCSFDFWAPNPVATGVTRRAVSVAHEEAECLNWRAHACTSRGRPVGSLWSLNVLTYYGELVESLLLKLFGSLQDFFMAATKTEAMGLSATPRSGSPASAFKRSAPAHTLFLSTPA